MGGSVSAADRKSEENMTPVPFRYQDNLVFIGDSQTQRDFPLRSEVPAKKYRVDYFGSYVDILMKKFLVHFPELELRAWNTGVSGATVPDLLEIAQEHILSLKPLMLPGVARERLGLTHDSNPRKPDWASLSWCLARCCWPFSRW